jgi:hypothetical protein
VVAFDAAYGPLRQHDGGRAAAHACTLGDNYVAYQVYSLAVAGDRVAYAQVEGNTGQSFDLVASQAGSTGELTGGNASGGSSLICSGACSGELVGAAGLLAYSSWTGAFVDGREVITTQEIDRADAITCPCPTLRTDPGPLVPLDADGGRIVAGGDNATVILGANGS